MTEKKNKQGNTSPNKHEQHEKLETIIIGNNDAQTDNALVAANEKVPTTLTFLILTWIILGSGCAYTLYLWLDAQTLLSNYERRLETLEAKTDHIPFYPNEHAQTDDTESPTADGTPLAAHQSLKMRAKKKEDNSIESQFEVLALQAQILAVDERIASLEQDLDTKIVVTEQQNKLLMAIVELRDRIKQQQPFAEELDKVQSLASGDSTILLQTSGLEEFADRGILNMDTLRYKFSLLTKDLLYAMRSAEQQSGILDKISSNFHKVVTIRKIGRGLEGDDIDSIIARAEAALKDGKIKPAIIEMDKVDPKVTHITEPWVSEARALLKSEQTFNKIYTHLTNSIAAKPAAAPTTQPITDSEEVTG